MSSIFSASSQALGYFYQTKAALLLLLECEFEEAELSLELADDATLELPTGDVLYAQYKHTLRTPASLTDSCADFWKSVRVWCHIANERGNSLDKCIFSLISTSSVPTSSSLRFLRESADRDTVAAMKELTRIAEESTNAKLVAAFKAFLGLDEITRQALVDSIYIIDGQPNIVEIDQRIRKFISCSVKKEFVGKLLRSVEGWWYSRACSSFAGQASASIKRFEVTDKIADLGAEYLPINLPIHYDSQMPTDEFLQNVDDRQFVVQLNRIGIKKPRIEKAIVDYYRAFEQRSRWAREDLLVDGELEKYERKLVEEWDRVRCELIEQLEMDQLPDDQLMALGRKVYRWAEIEANIPIRRLVSEPFVTRGSFQMLADSASPRVWWHPKFVS